MSAPNHLPEYHATRAAELLDGIAALEQRLDEMTADERLQMAVGGGYSRANRNLEWTATLATAHALVAVALTLGAGAGVRPS